MADVWDNCPRGDWLIWLSQRVDAGDDRTLRLFAVWCARSTPLGDGRVTGDLLTDPRSRAALEVAERYAHGQATADELATAAAAYAAAAAAYAYATAAYAADDAAAAAAAARLAQANQFRRMVANPFRPEGGAT
jgi:hypothetical protein